MKRNNLVSISDKHSYVYSLRKQAVYLLKPQDTIIRSMTYPKMKKKELHEAIVTEYLSYAAMSGGTPYVNWEIVGEKDNELHILAIGVKREYLDQLYEELRKTDGVHVFASVALVGVVAELVKDLSEEKDFGVIFIGDNQTDLLFYKEGRAIYGRNINIGKNDIFKEVGYSERDITDLLSYVDEAIIRNFASPVKVYVASISYDDKDIVSVLSKFSSYELLSFNELMEITAADTHEAILRASWNLGVSGHPLYVFVPPAYKQWQKMGRRVFYVSVLLLVTLLLGAGSLNLTYTKLGAMKMELEAKKRQVQVLKDEVAKLEPFEKQYNNLLKQREAVGKLAFVENEPMRYWRYYNELFAIVNRNKGNIISIGATAKDMVNLSLVFPSESSMLKAISDLKHSDLFSRIIIYMTAKSVSKGEETFTLSIGVKFK